MRIQILLLLAATATLAACSGGSGATNGASTNAAQATAPATPPGPSGSACDRHLISQADVQPLLSAPIVKVEPIPGDPQSCQFETAGSSAIQVTLRPGLGNLSLDAIASGQANQVVVPLPGVGDRAVYNPALKEVEASKNNVLCDITAAGGPDTAPATEAQVAALCTKIFAGL